MSLESALYGYLSGVSAVTDLVGTRIYPAQAPQGAELPYVVHHRISTRRFPHQLGPSGMVRARIQIDSFGITLDSAQAVFDVLRDNLDGWRAAVMDDVYVQSVNLEDEANDFTAPQDGGDIGVHRVRADFIFVYAESDTSV